MIIHLLNEYNLKNIILASNSPRRKEILNKIGLKFIIQSSPFDEKTLDKSTFLNYKEFVMESSYQKAYGIFKKEEDSIVIGCDTIIILNNKILEKPKDEKEAFEMLSSLSDQEHIVCTGLSILSKKKQQRIYEETKVKFSKLTKEMIESYIETKEPMDKAGSYGIQGIGGSFIERIEGCYYNVMGLPLNRFCKELLNH